MQPKARFCTDICRVDLLKAFAYYLSGVVATDYSDASGTLLLDVKNKRWSLKMANVCGISLQNLPELHESYDVIGTVKHDIAVCRQKIREKK